MPTNTNGVAVTIVACPLAAFSDEECMSAFSHLGGLGGLFKTDVVVHIVDFSNFLNLRAVSTWLRDSPILIPSMFYNPARSVIIVSPKTMRLFDIVKDLLPAGVRTRFEAGVAAWNELENLGTALNDAFNEEEYRHEERNGQAIWYHYHGWPVHYQQDEFDVEYAVLSYEYQQALAEFYMYNSESWAN